jgi:pimeloyl-ACP methyl ester carboxylesterase
MQKVYVKSKEQRKASSYVFDLISPKAVEIVRENDYQIFREMGIFENKNAFDEQKDLEAWSQPGSLEAGCNYYKALVNPKTRGTGELGTGGALAGAVHWDGTVAVPTLVIHGMQDFAILPVTLEGLEDYVKDLKIIRSETSGHWIMDDSPELVISSIQDFIKS